MPLNNAPSLTSVPREIFDSIITSIEDRADISSLSRTSKAIRSITAELVFKDVTMLWTGNDILKQRSADAVQNAESLRRQNPSVIEISPGCECPRLDLLLRSILENPDCGNYIRRINLQCVRYRDSAPFGTKPKLPSPPNTNDYWSLIMVAMRRVGIHQLKVKKEFEAGLRSNDFDTVVGFLILLCPNITSLTLGLDVIVRNSILNLILKVYALATELTGCISRLQHLKDNRLGISFESETSRFLVEWPRIAKDRILDLDAYLMLLYLPNLKQAELSLPLLGRWEGEKYLEWPAKTPPNSALQALRLPECSLLPDNLRIILDRTPRITRLEYDLRLWSYYKLQADDLNSALLCIRNSLKHFKFEHSHWTNEDPFIGQRGTFEDDYEYVNGYCSLTELTALETVTIPSCVLLGWLERNCPDLADVLPRNLVTICLADDLSWFDTYEKDKEDLMPTIQRFVGKENWRTTTPRLEEFNLRYVEWEEKDETIALFKQNGLACQMVPPNTHYGH